MLRDTLLAVFSAILLILCFPAFDVSSLAWVALVPLFLAIVGRSPTYGFFLSLVCGVLFFGGVFYWGLEVTSYTLLHHFLLSLCFGSYLALIGLVISLISRWRGATFALFALPFVWISLEYVKSTFSFLAFPYALLAHSQYQNPRIIQIASVTGTYGVSFLIVAVNAAIVAAIYPLLSRLIGHKLTPNEIPSARGRMAVVGAAATSIAVALSYGHMTVSKPIVGHGIKVSVVQGNIEQVKKWDPRYAKFIVQTYANLTLEASRDQPALIIWPETATPRSITLDPGLYGQVRRLAKSAGAHLLLGSSQHQKFKRERSKKIKYLNSAFLIPPEVGKARNQRYDKIRLLPFGEYLPLKGTVPWSYITIPDIHENATGNKFTVFEAPDLRFGVTICWENIFPDLVRQFVKGGARFLVNITNEAFFGKTAAPYQFMAISVFRAVENRVFVVRCANTGVSCFIDPYGRIADRVKDAKGQDIFVRGVLTRTIIPMDAKTIYTRYGDLLAWLSILCSAGFLIIAFLSKNSYHPDDSVSVS